MTLPPSEVLCDENVSGDVVRFLRNRGHRVHLPAEFALNGEPDGVVLAVAATNGLVLIMENRGDFRRLHALWMILLAWGLRTAPHAGILSVFEQEVGTLRWAEALDERLRRPTPLTGEMHWWRNRTGL